MFWQRAKGFIRFWLFLPSLQSFEFFLPLCVCVEETCAWGNCMPFFFYSNSNPSLLKLPFILVFIWILETFWCILRGCQNSLSAIKQVPPSSLSKVPPTNHSWQNSLASRIRRGQGSSLIAIRDAWVCDLYTSIHNWCGRSQSKCGSTDIFRKLFVQGGYEWLVTVVSIVYLLTFCVFELLGMVSQEFSGKGRTDQV